MILIKRPKFPWQITIFPQTTVLFHFCALRCDEINRIRNDHLFTYVQFSAPNASTASCFNHRLLALWLGKHDTSSRCLKPHSISPSAISLYHFRTTSAASLSASTSLLLVFLQICVCIIFFGFSLCVTLLTNLLSPFSPLSRCIAIKLPGKPIPKRKVASYCSGSSLILLLVQFCNMSNVTECGLVLYVQRMSSHSVVDVFLSSSVKIQFMMIDGSYRYWLIPLVSEWKFPNLQSRRDGWLTSGIWKESADCFQEFG